MSIYLDNAATTALDEQVLEAMLPWFRQGFGNPSSTHSHGREARGAIEMARKKIAELLGSLPGEIYFLSGGTEADNTALRGSIRYKSSKKALSSPLEHHAVLHPLEAMQNEGLISLDLVPVSEKGKLDYDFIEKWVENNPGSVLSFMYANNEIANINDLKRIGEMCRKHDCFLHSDTVQAMGHFPIDSQSIGVDSMVCSAHKIHGPKGIGFLYLRKGNPIVPFQVGGSQERSMRGGTENVAGIVGLAKAFELAHIRMEEDRKHIQSLKDHMISGLRSNIPNIRFNGESDSSDSLYTVLNVCFPPHDSNEFLLFNLDMKGISASGGSACNSGADKGSHVLQALRMPDDHVGVRFSFSRENTVADIDNALAAIKEILA